MARDVELSRDHFGDYFEVDLSELENTIAAKLRVHRTTSDDLARGFPDGVTLWADRRYHGADLHLPWGVAKQLRDALDYFLSLEPKG